MRNGTCSYKPDGENTCGKTGNVIIKTIPSIGDICYVCNAIRLAENKPVKKFSSIKSKRKPTGEAVLFQALWNSRARVSFVSGTWLGNEAQAWFFAHVLPKGKYQSFRLFAENIVFLTQEEHDIWDKQPRSKLIDKPEWKKMFLKEYLLKKMYLKEYTFKQNHKTFIKT